MLKIRLVKKRQRWSLTFYGWLLLLVFLIALFVLFLKNIIGFLSFEETIEAKVLVAEGYVPDYSFHKMIEIFDEGNYELIVASGTSFDQGYYLSEIKTSADLIARSLIFLGFDSTKLAVVPIPNRIHKNRTYTSALVTKEYLQKNHPEIKKVNIMSLGPHSRRSNYLFEMAYEPEIEVGNIVVPHAAVDKYNWYKSSRGFRTVLDELIGFFYVKFFFWPDENEQYEK